MTTTRVNPANLRRQWKQIYLGLAAVLIAQTPAHACDFNAPVAVCNQETVDTLQPELTGYFLDTRTTEFWPFVRLLATKSVIQRSVAFRPDATATRAEALKMVMQSLSTAKPTWQSALSSASNACVFADVRLDDWFYGHVRDAVKAGLISCQTQFRPNDAITRQEFAKIAHNALMLFDTSMANVDVATTPPFTDAASFDQSLLPFARKLRARGVLSGYPDGTFRPLTLVTRGQIAKIVGNSFFPMEGFLEFSLGDPAMPSNYLSVANKTDISSLAPPFATLEAAEKLRAGSQGLDFAHYTGFSPAVAYSAALMSAVTYETDADILNWLQYNSMERVGLHQMDVDWWPDDFRFFVSRRQRAGMAVEYVVAIRGTESNENWVLDGIFKGTSCRPAVGSCHKGFHDLAEYVYNILAFSSQYSTMRLELGLAGENTVTLTKARLSIVGHSLGGAAGHILHAMLLEGSPAERTALGQRIQSYSIGAPVSGDSVFATEYANQRMYRIRREGDTVPVVGAGLTESLYGIHVGEQHGFAHTTQIRAFDPSAIGISGPPVTMEVPDPLSYAYVSPGESWPHPDWVGIKPNEHNAGGYTELLREFLKNSPIAQNLQTLAQRYVP